MNRCGRQLLSADDITRQDSVNAGKRENKPSIAALCSESDKDSIDSKQGTFSVSSLARQAKQDKWTEYVLWENKNSSCWLDTSLTFLISNRTLAELLRLRPDKSSVLKWTFDLYTSIQDMFKTDKNYTQFKDKLEEIRQGVWRYLKPKLALCEGDHDSPLFALPLLLKEDPRICKKFEVSYTVNFHCKECGFSKRDRMKKIIIPLPNTVSDLQIPGNICFHRKCYQCGKHDQISTINFDRPPDILMLQFVQGMPKDVFWREQCESYNLSHIIQYTGSHFICWSSNIGGTKWMRGDDLKDTVSSYSYSEPECCAKEVHIVVWEKRRSVSASGGRTLSPVVFQPIKTKSNSSSEPACSLEDIDVQISLKGKSIKRYQPYRLRRVSAKQDTSNIFVETDNAEPPAPLLQPHETSDCTSVSGGEFRAYVSDKHKVSELSGTHDPLYDSAYSSPGSDPVDALDSIIDGQLNSESHTGNSGFNSKEALDVFDRDPSLLKMVESIVEGEEEHEKGPSEVVHVPHMDCDDFGTVGNFEFEIDIGKLL